MVSNSRKPHRDLPQGTDCTTDGCETETRYDIAVNGVSQPFCEPCTLELLTYLTDHPGLVLGIAIEGEDSNGEPVRVAYGTYATNTSYRWGNDD